MEKKIKMMDTRSDITQKDFLKWFSAARREDYHAHKIVSKMKAVLKGLM